MHVDQSEKDAQDGVHYTTVFAGERKNDLNPHEPISSEAHAFLKAEVNRIYGLFVETVARHRGIEPSAVRDTEAGLFFGQAAVAMGLADAVGTFDDALEQLLASLSPNPTPVAVAALDAGAFGDRITVEISAERDGLSSWQPQVRVMDRAGYGLRWGQYWGGV